MCIERGILLIATSHSYYGRMAFNLAATIKAVEPEMQVAIAADGVGLTHLSDKQKRIFDIIIQMPTDVPQGFAPKLYLDTITPFERTLFLDVDMAWLPQKTPSELFDELEAYDYTGITEGFFDIETEDNTQANKAYYYWGEPSDIKKAYGLTTGKLYQWRSEVIYFKKTKQVIDFFEDAREVLKNPKVTVMRFGGHIPDELGINISAALHGIEPHEYKWSPAYWHRLNQDHVPDLSALLGDWYLISFGSNHVSGTVKRIHDQVVSLALRKLGMQHVFALHSKKDFMSTRTKM